MLKNILTLLLFFSSSILYAGITGTLKGKVVDKKTGDPLIGCNIIIVGTDLGAATDIDGNYKIIKVPPGNYKIQVIMIGYAKTNISNVLVQSDLTTTINASLIQDVISSEEVNVIATRPLITKDLTASTSIINSDMISSLPVTEVSEILELQAGFVQGHLRGGRSGEVAYWVDGIPMTDVFDGGAIVDVNTNAIAEMQVISGAFNAEYGQAMSGIVNIVTKDGSKTFKGNATLYGGDFLSNRKNTFLNINEFSPTTTKNLELNLEGPIVDNKLFYNLTFRNIYYQGVFEGLRRFNPDNISYFDQNDNFNLHRLNISNGDTLNPGKGDNTFVPMDWNRKGYMQSKIIYNVSPVTKLKYTIINDKVDYQSYDRMFRYNPDGNLNRYRNGITHLLQLNHSFSNNSFITFGITSFKKSYNHRTYNEDELEKYVHPKLLNSQPYSFLTGGTNLSVFSRSTGTTTIKSDLTSQWNKQNKIKTGLSLDFIVYPMMTIL